MSDQVDIWSLSDLATPWCVGVATTLGVAGHLAGGSMAIGELADKVGADGEYLARVLRQLAGKGLFAEPVPGEFALTEGGRVLLDPGPQHDLDLDGHGGRIAGAWSGLLTAVRTGRPAYETVYGTSFWDDLDAHPEIAASYDTLMGPAGGFVPDPAILVHDDWDEVRHVVDVGGGTGAMLAEVLRAHPGVRGTLVDLPRTVARSGEVFDAAGVGDRVTTSGQSFFDPLPAGADVYLLKRVLLDWPDREATQLLARCAEAAAPHGRVVVAGGVSEGRAAGQGGLLTMLVSGGRPRSLDEFRLLAANAGLTVTAAGAGPSGRYVVESRPAPAA